MRKTMKWFQIAGVLVACAALALPALAQSTKIGVFNPQRVIEESDEGKKIKARLEQLFEEKQKELQAQETAIGEMQKQLQTQGLSLSDDKREQLQREIQRKVLDLNSAQERARQDLQLEQETARRRFEEQLLAVVADFGRREGFTVILDAGSIAWATETVDCTTAIIDSYNAVMKSARGS